eukprot:scaffold22810_cov127-Isochrysis_galbana.AAC.2
MPYGARALRIAYSAALTAHPPRVVCPPHCGAARGVSSPFTPPRPRSLFATRRAGCLDLAPLMRPGVGAWRLCIGKRPSPKMLDIKSNQPKKKLNGYSAVTLRRSCAESCAGSRVLRPLHPAPCGTS